MKPQKKNIFDIPEGAFAAGKEFFETLASGEGFRLERICSLPYGRGAVYDQSEDEFVLLLSGSAELDFDGDALEMKAGDCAIIPAHTRHSVLKTSASPNCVWLAAFGTFSKK